MAGQDSGFAVPSIADQGLGPGPNAPGSAGSLPTTRMAAQRRGPPTIWASGGGEYKIAYGLPAGCDALAFRFSPGDPTYRRLVSTPGLRATIVIDRATSRILNVRFRAAERPGPDVSLLTTPPGPCDGAACWAPPAA